jgi:hypothetical protein
MSKEVKGNNSLSRRIKMAKTTMESGNGRSVFDFSKLESEVEFYKPGQGRNAIHIIPFTVKTNRHPLKLEKGDMDYGMAYWVHKRVGIDEVPVLCLQKNFGKPCPVCEAMMRARNSGDKTEAKALSPSRRVIYNVEDLKDTRKIKIFDVSYFLFEKELLEEAEENDYFDFANADDSGAVIKFRVSKQSAGDFEFDEYKSFSLVKRDSPLSESLLKKAVSFDKLLIVQSYEQIKNLLLGSNTESDDIDDEDDYDDDDPPLRKQSGRRNRDNDETDDIDDEDESDEPDEDEDDDPPPPPPPAKKKKAVKPRDIEDEDDDPPPSPAKNKKARQCDYGYRFGKDVDTQDECDDCENWAFCKEKADK